MMNLRHNKCDMVLSGDQLSGSTYPVKDFIKSKLDGKFNSETKSWTVDADKVNYWIEKGAISVNNSDHSNAQAAHSHGKRTGTAASNGWCDLCHSYCWGDCQA